jgi:hypothetical protein
MKIGLMNGLSLGQTPNTAFANFVNLIDLFHQVNSWRLYRHIDAAIQPSSHPAVTQGDCLVTLLPHSPLGMRSGGSPEKCGCTCGSP